MTKAPLTYESALARMAALCNRSEQCEDDLRRKMARGSLAGADADKIIARLKETRMLDNGRFARLTADYKVRFCGWGRNKIRTALYGKRISATDISAALSAIDEEEYGAALRRVCNAKARTLELTNREAAMKLYRHLLSRGFESPLASAAVRDAIRAFREQQKD